MNLAADEIGIIVVGLAVGYWVVSYFLERGRSPDDSRTRGVGPMSAPSSSARTPWWVELGVQPDASHEQIVRAYEMKIAEFHPHKVAHLGEDMRVFAARKAEEVSAAYEEALAIQRADSRPRE
jgi:preprotein translocase subunit Sec63